MTRTQKIESIKEAYRVWLNSRPRPLDKSSLHRYGADIYEEARNLYDLEWQQGVEEHEGRLEEEMYR